MIAGAFVLLLIMCIGAYFAFGPGNEKAASASATPAGGVEIPKNLPGEPVKGEPIRTASGMAYYELKEGTGRKPAGPTSRRKQCPG